MPRGIFPPGELRIADGGLFSVADVTKHSGSDVNWTSTQYSWDTVACPVRLSIGDYCVPVGNGVVSESEGLPPTAWPFGIVTSYICLTPGLSVAERHKIARQQAEAGSQKAVEAELWAGFAAQSANHLTSQYLNDNRAIDVTGAGPVSAPKGLAKLEQALADCGLGATGIIHLTRQAASLASATGGLEWNDEGNHAQTHLGTPVVAGTGYNPSVTPADPANNPFPPPTGVIAQPDTQWGFITGPVYVHLGPVEVFEDYIDIATNTLTVDAGRPAAVYWDSCCVAMVQMDLSL